MKVPTCLQVTRVMEIGQQPMTPNSGQLGQQVPRNNLRIKRFTQLKLKSADSLIATKSSAQSIPWQKQMPSPKRQWLADPLSREVNETTELSTIL
ncbi:hypothetical protein T07_7132 [Trichinella nelsoni]|uniref:Uncharacterized protein n=1 Tax=Trichinella nelsoni TaxID=6336 RepID=A0A0V0SM02_9BILA|nr:hypothetical protein T07_7132 [Trichinella nelsoni]